MKLLRKKIKGKSQENLQFRGMLISIKLTKSNKIMINCLINLVSKRNIINEKNLIVIKIIVLKGLREIKKFNSNNNFSSNNNIVLMK